jgi:hypothetical protein
VLQEAAELAPKETPADPELREANFEIFFLTSGLPQDGQTTSSVALALRTNSSKSFSHVTHTNSNKGISLSCFVKLFLLFFYLNLDVNSAKRLQKQKSYYGCIIPLCDYRTKLL